jgi:hypothetical protein
MTPAGYSIEIPPEVIHTTRMSPQDMKRELALALFQQEKISFGKAREMAGMTVWAFQQLLGSLCFLPLLPITDRRRLTIDHRPLTQHRPSSNLNPGKISL